MDKITINKKKRLVNSSNIRINTAEVQINYIITCWALWNKIIPQHQKHF